MAVALPQAASPAPSASSVTVTLSDYAIRLSRDVVPPGRVTVRVVNRGNAVHDLSIGGRRTRPLAHGEREMLSIDLAQGVHSFSSSRPGDAALGMRGVIRASAGSRAKPLVTRSRLTLRTIATDLGALTSVASPPGDPRRLLVTRQDGLVLLFRDGARVERPFLDLRPVVRAQGEKGLLSIAFAPDYATSGRFYVFYTNRDGNIRLLERRRSPGDADIADTNWRRVLALPKQTANHNGGMMQFGPDGYLYVSIGDGGASPPGIPVGRSGQLTSDMFGTILRIDPSGGMPYRVPVDNPFVAVEGARPEIAAYGLRNPWRFWIDAPTGVMFIGDVGEGAREEVNVLPLNRLGLNFGWPCREGSVVPDDVPLPDSCRTAQLAGPLYEYPHTEKRCSITGGVVMRDPRLRALRGLYVWSDFCEGRLNALTRAGKVVPLNLTLRQPTSFGTDATGRVYVATAGGTLVRLELRPTS